MSIMGGAGGGAVALVSRIPKPSIMARSTPPNAAALAAERGPADNESMLNVLSKIDIAATWSRRDKL